MIQSAGLDIDGDGRTDYIGAQYRPGLIFWLENPKNPTSDPWPYHLIDDFTKGVIDTTHVIYYLSLITFGLFLTARSVDTERWRG